MQKLACPKCHEPLHLEGNSYYCPNRHTYDLAKRKYLNLLLNPDKNSNNPGDNKDSLNCRKAFLNKGYYDPISDTLNRYIAEHSHPDMQILDLGCGEGYYLARMKKMLNHEDYTYYGLDIAKDAIMMATQYDRSIYWLVGNSKNLPLLDHSMDVISCLFTVVNAGELARVIKKDGYIIHVTANPRHLIEIKELIYDEIHVKPDTFIRLPFPIIDQFDLVQPIQVTSHEDCLNLLKMTPHYYHIKKERRENIEHMQEMNITIDIQFTIYGAFHES